MKRVLTASVFAVIVSLLGVGFSLAQWGPPVNLGPTVNSSWDERDCSITADGTKLYFTSNKAGGHGGYDIWVTTWDGTGWAGAVNLGPPINTSGDENFVSVSADGTKLYFIAFNRYGEFLLRTWVSNYSDDEWQEPMIIPQLAWDFYDVYVASSDTTLFFSGSGDPPLDVGIILTRYINGEWRGNWPLNINSDNGGERMGCLSFDETQLYFWSTRPAGGGGWRNWVATGGGAEWYDPTLLGTNINDGQTKVECISSDGNKLFIISEREGGFGGRDIWVSQKIVSVEDMSWGKIKNKFR